LSCLLPPSKFWAQLACYKYYEVKSLPFLFPDLSKHHLRHSYLWMCVSMCMHASICVSVCICMCVHTHTYFIRIHCFIVLLQFPSVMICKIRYWCHFAVIWMYNIVKFLSSHWATVDFSKRMWLHGHFYPRQVSLLNSIHTQYIMWFYISSDNSVSFYYFMTCEPNKDQNSVCSIMYDFSSKKQ
jgi:hypothetical protein